MRRRSHWYEHLARWIDRACCTAIGIIYLYICARILLQH